MHKRKEMCGPREWVVMCERALIDDRFSNNYGNFFARFVFVFRTNFLFSAVAAHRRSTCDRKASSSRVLTPRRNNPRSHLNTNRGLVIYRHSLHSLLFLFLTLAAGWRYSSHAHAPNIIASILVNERVTEKSESVRPVKFVLFFVLCYCEFLTTPNNFKCTGVRGLLVRWTSNSITHANVFFPVPHFASLASRARVKYTSRGYLFFVVVLDVDGALVLFSLLCFWRLCVMTAVVVLEVLMLLPPLLITLHTRVIYFSVAAWASIG